MNEKKDDLVDGVKRLGGEVRKVSNSTALAIAAAIGVVAALGWNEAMKAIFALFLSAEATPAVLVGYAIFATVVAMLVGKWAKKEDAQAASAS
ncbi:MAG: DUF5654 family protein [bacterium]|nr:DUF5654 family protein [bacterium]